MFTKLRNALNPGISRDPLMYLPLEMVEIIIDHLDMRDRVYDDLSRLNYSANTLLESALQF